MGWANNRFINSISIVILFLLVIWGTSTAVSYIKNIAKEEPGQNFLQTLVGPSIIGEEDPLVFKVTRAYSKGCEVYSIRRIFLNDILRLEMLGRPENITSDGILKVYPRLPPGHYIYQTTIHIVCKNDSYVRSSPLFPFTIQ